MSELGRQVFVKARASVALSTADASHSKISCTFFPPVTLALLAEKKRGQDNNDDDMLVMIGCVHANFHWANI